MVKSNNVLEIKKGVYWLGIYRNEQLELNIYLRVFEKDDKKVFMIVDPGPPVIFDDLRNALEKQVGNLRKIQFVFLNHQDPDVCFNTLYLAKYNPKLKVICTEDTWRLVNFLGLTSDQFQSIDKFKSLRGRVSTGHTFQFVPTPFCHFRGATMLYDESSRILFTGDLFGGLTYSAGLYATSVNWHGIRLFHQMYMPSQKAIQAAIDAIRNLTPKPEILAPQHGALIKGDLIDEFMNKLYELPVGPDLLITKSEIKEFYMEAINEIAEMVGRRVGDEIVKQAFEKVNADPTFPNLFELDAAGKVWNIKIDPAKSFQMWVAHMQENQPGSVQEAIKSAILKASVDWNLPLYEAFKEEMNDTEEDLIEES